MKNVVIKMILVMISLSLIISFGVGCSNKKAQAPQGKKTDQVQGQQAQKAKTEQTQDANTTSEGNQAQSAPMAPDFTALDQNGNEVKLSDLKGKVVFLNFWGTWCPPCKEEMPYIQKVFEKYSEERDDVAFLGVNDLTYPKEKSMDEVIQWLEDNQYTFPVVFDQDGTIIQEYGIQAFPTTYMIDKKGRIYGYVTGGIEEQDMIDIIEQTLALDTEK